jgi:hypothetical protein
MRAWVICSLNTWGARSSSPTFYVTSMKMPRWDAFICRTKRYAPPVFRRRSQWQRWRTR